MVNTRSANYCMRYQGSYTYTSPSSTTRRQAQTVNASLSCDLDNFLSFTTRGQERGGDSGVFRLERAYNVVLTR